MDRKAYNSCMKPYMTGGGEDRKLRFCIGAKLCSGKVDTEEIAKEICLVPKPAKMPKMPRANSGDQCEKRVMKVIECMVEKIDMNLASNINSIGIALANAMTECVCKDESDT